MPRPRLHLGIPSRAAGRPRATTSLLVVPVVLALIVLGVVGVALPAGLPGGPGTAFAHDTLVGSDPADGASLDAAPAAVVLTFSDAQLALGAGTAVSVRDADGTEWADGPAVVEGEVVTQALRAGQGAGEFTVLWRSVASDGHPITGTTSYTLTAAAAPAPTPTPAPPGATATAAPAPGSPDLGSTPEATPVPEQAPRSGLGLAPLLLAGLAVAAVAAAATVVARRRGEGA